jgi:hypothetical protein
MQTVRFVCAPANPDHSLFAGAVLRIGNAGETYGSMKNAAARFDEKRGDQTPPGSVVVAAFMHADGFIRNIAGTPFDAVIDAELAH